MAKKPVHVLLIFVVPFIIFLVYWGMSSAGLTREGLHAWVIGLILGTVVTWQVFPCNSQAVWRVCNWALLLRGLEILLMLLLPTIASNNMLVQKQFEITDAVSLATMPAIVGFLTFHVFSFAEKVRRTAHSRQKESESCRTSSAPVPPLIV